jgi:hypothetical protein
VWLSSTVGELQIIALLLPVVAPYDPTSFTILGNWNNLKIIQEVPEQHNWKPRHQGNTENDRLGHCAFASESNNVKAQNVYHGK